MAVTDLSGETNTALEDIEENNICCKDKDVKPSKLSSAYVGILNIINFTFLLGTLKSSPIFFFQLQHEFDGSAAEITTIYSIFFVFYFMGGPLYGAYFKMAGAKVSLVTAGVLYALAAILTSISPTFFTVILSYGVLRGTGCGLGMLVSYSINGQTFSRHLPLVNNLGAVSSSIFAAAFAPLFQTGIELYSWRGVMLLMGGVLLNMIPVGWVTSNIFEHEITHMPRQKVSTQNALSQIKKSFDVQLMKNRTFVIYIFANSGIDTFRLLKGIYLVRYAQSIGISDQASSLFITMYQVSYITCCLLTGLMLSRAARYASKHGTPVAIKTSTVVIYSSLATCVVNFFPIIWETYWGYAVYTILSGMLTGFLGNLPITIVSEIVGKDRVSSALGFTTLFSGLFLCTIPTSLGLLIDFVDSYKPMMYAMTFFALFGSVLLKIVQVRIDKVRKKANETNKTEYNINE